MRRLIQNLVDCMSEGMYSHNEVHFVKMSNGKNQTNEHYHSCKHTEFNK